MSDGGHDSPRAVVERWYDSLARMNLEDFAATLRDDLVLNVAGRTPISGRSLGKTKLFAEIFPLVVKNLDPASINLARRHRIMAVDGEIVVGMMEGGARTLSGELYEQQYCQVFRVRNGLIAEIWEFFDTVQCEVRLFDQPYDVGNQPDEPLRF